ncbi:hypothetical protein ASPWEDRAFT_679004 [Aspergillus wentii DTO 134E9]|uniref:Uncharacterized protein n=1 Tax=Aspergillus wentii DTO 134E9 TaxID=1073089 RepID=A0A1L9R849_ASPWE|nr:uncharacterized protein ASPWEDRAFT_679004 [Aspergillus wentii DTO 134E9]OJJ31096.1 hypothetical protein ASPWEDRAFT_679004 [Aspergillus wentii DTO 134E9]
MLVILNLLKSAPSPLSISVSTIGAHISCSLIRRPTALREGMRRNSASDWPVPPILLQAFAKPIKKHQKLWAHRVTETPSALLQHRHIHYFPLIESQCTNCRRNRDQLSPTRGRGISVFVGEDAFIPVCCLVVERHVFFHLSSHHSQNGPRQSPPQSHPHSHCLRHRRGSRGLFPLQTPP